MKAYLHSFLVALASFVLIVQTAAAEDWVDTYDRLLTKYATEKGVRYREWHSNAADLQALDRVVGAIATAEVPKPHEQALAFYLNAYNAWVLHNILAKYPTEGPLDGETFFFHGKRIRVAGKKMSLDTLEQKIIRPTFGEPRIHFALNCASVSCPPLASKAFRAERLDRDLDRLTKAFIRNRAAVHVDAKSGKLRVSKIFEWYKQDFEDAGGVIPFINRYSAVQFDHGVKLDPLDYDWSLNHVPAQ